MTDQPREIAVVLHEGVLGGASLAVIRLVPSLESRGWTFRFWAPRPSVLFDQLEARGMRADGAPRPISYSRRGLRLPPGPLGRLRATPGYLGAFRAWIRAEPVALVHANSILTLAEASVAARLGAPILLHVHEMLPGGWQGRAARQVASRLPGKVIGVSRSSARPLARRGAPVGVVYGGAPIPAEVPDRSQRGGPTLVGTVGVTSTRKGSDVFVAAASLLREREPDIEFRMVGAPTDELEVDWGEAVLERARRAGIAVERSANVPQRLAEWDVFALPSRSDPFPISMLEAMGSGLPAIGADVDGISEQLAGGAGVLVPPDDPAALAEAITALHRDPVRRTELGKIARARVQSRYTLERQAEALESAYLETIQAVPKAPRSG